jgi:Domain of unknown function (DUF4384)
MRTPGVVWVFLAAGLLLPDLGGAEISGAKAIFTSGEGPIVVVETPDSSAPTGRLQYPASPKTEAASQDEPQRHRYIGFSYWAELLDGDGQGTRMTTDRIFRRGDRVRLNIMSNWNAYFYVVSLTSTGRSQVFFPHPAVSSGNSFVGASTLYEAPPDAHIRCDDASGEEAIWLMLSPTPLSGITLSPSPQMQVLSREDTAHLVALAYLKGTKSLLLEVDTSSPQPASYVVAPLAMLEGSGEMISVQVRLKHECTACLMAAPAPRHQAGAEVCLSEAESALWQASKQTLRGSSMLQQPGRERTLNDCLSLIMLEMLMRRT